MANFKAGDLVTWANFGNGTKRQPGRKDLTDRGYSVGTKAIVLEFLEEHPKLEPGRTGVRLRWLDGEQNFKGAPCDWFTHLTNA
jgi:hypothetical protein